MAIVTSGRQAKAQHNLTTTSGRQAKASHGRVRSGRQAKSGQSLRLTSARQARSRQATQTFVEAYLAPTVAGVKRAARTPIAVTVKQWENGVPTVMTPLSYEIVRRRNQPATFSLRFSNEDRSFSPGGSWDGMLDGNPYDDEWAVQRYITIEMSVAGQPNYMFPYFLQLDLTLEVRRGQAYAVLSGTDYSDLLLQPDQGMDDVTINPNSAPPFRSSAAVLAEILAEYNVDDYGLDSDSFVIQKMHRQGTPMDWVRELLWVTQADWRWEGKRFLTYQTSLKTAPDWKFNSNLHLTTLSYRKAARLVKNRFTLTRLDDVSGLLLDLDTTEEDGVEPGWQGPFDLTYPTRNMRTKEVRVLGGRLHNWIFLDENDNTVGFKLTNNGFVWVGQPSAHKVKFVYEPTLDYMLTGRPYGYKVQIEGHQWMEHAELGSFDSSYTATYNDTDSQAEHGIRAEPPIDNTLVPNLSIAQQCVQRLTAEGVRRGSIGVWETPLVNPYLYPGQTAGITDYRLNLDNVPFLVEAVTFRGQRGRHTMTIEAARPIT